MLASLPDHARRSVHAIDNDQINLMRNKILLSFWSQPNCARSATAIQRNRRNHESRHDSANDKNAIAFGAFSVAVSMVCLSDSLDFKLLASASEKANKFRAPLWLAVVSTEFSTFMDKLLTAVNHYYAVCSLLPPFAPLRCVLCIRNARYRRAPHFRSIQLDSLIYAAGCIIGYNMSSATNDVQKPTLYHSRCHVDIASN